jgi:Ribbon-helix-helix protein, copG family
MKIVTVQLSDEDTRVFDKRLAETHKTQSELLRQIIHTYFEFDRAGYLSEDGGKIAKLETEIQLKEKLRSIEAQRLKDKLNFAKDLEAVTEAGKKQRARDRAMRNGPRVDWGDSVGTERTTLGDGFSSE